MPLIGGNFAHPQSLSFVYLEESTNVGAQLVPSSSDRRARPGHQPLRFDFPIRRVRSGNAGRAVGAADEDGAAGCERRRMLNDHHPHPGDAAYFFEPLCFRTTRPFGTSRCTTAISSPSYTRWFAEAMTAIADAVAHGAAQEEEEEELGSRGGGPTHLVLGRTPLDVVGVTSIATMLRGNACVEELTVRHCGTTAGLDMWRILAKGASANTGHLRKLELHEGNVDDVPGGSGGARWAGLDAAQPGGSGRGRGPQRRRSPRS
jgi:hypothetical protein